MFGRPYDPPYGLLSTHKHQQGNPCPLHLVKVEARASILDLSAQVTLVQVYRNDTDHTVEASYVFPVPDRAAVCAFILVKQDGTRIVGVIEEKEEAKKQYDEAVEAGKLASLAEQATTDTFRCSLGNILKDETVSIELVYVTELTEGDTSDSIRFHLPSRVGIRYGSPPPSAFGSSAPYGATSSSSTVPFTLALSVESVAPIAKISSPSHPISTELGPDTSLPNASSLPFSNYARISFSTTTTLERDFVLELTSPGFDEPRCLAEHHPSPDIDSVAISITFVPRFKLPEVEGQEFIFLVDRSGSMGGNRIQSAKAALVVLLRGMPYKGTTFNLVSFGTRVEALWKGESRSYSQTTLDEATSHVDGIEANFGGTEMRKALESVFEGRRKDRPTSVFLLTDGDAWDLAGVFDSMKTAVASSSPTAPLRVFVLGVGNSISTALCDGIARHGNGIAQYVVDGESFTGKTTRLLKAAKTPMIVNARLEFGEALAGEQKEDDETAEEEFELVEPQAKEGDKEGEKVVQLERDLETISLFDKDVDPLADSPTTSPPPSPPIDLPPTPPIQQAPAKIHLIPGSRIHAYAILSPASLLPKTVTLHGELASGQKLSLDILVTTSQLDTSTSSPPLASAIPPPIHTLAARKLIQSFEDGETDPSLSPYSLSAHPLHSDLRSRVVKASIIRLAKSYFLISTHTSFIAIDESELDKPHKPIPTSPKFPPPAPYGTMVAVSYGAPLPAGFGGSAKLSGGPAPTGASFGQPSAGRGGTLFGAAPGGGGFSSGGGGLFGLSRKSSGNVSRGGGGLFGAASSLFGSSSSSIPQAQMQSTFAAAAPAAVNSYAAIPPPPALSSFAAASFGAPTSQAAPAPSFSNAIPTPSSRLDAFARLQSFEGSFTPSVLSLCALAASSLADLISKLPFEQQSIDDVEKVVSTLAVLALWEREMAGEKDEWEEMGEKAKGFVARTTGRNAEEAEELLRSFL